MEDGSKNAIEAFLLVSMDTQLGEGGRERGEVCLVADSIDGGVFSLVGVVEHVSWA